MHDTQGYTQLGLLLTNKEDVVRDMEGKKKKKKRVAALAVAIMQYWSSRS